MITIKDVVNIHGRPLSLSFDSEDDVVIDGAGLTALPALIDPHVHFRVPGAEHKEDWRIAAQAAVAGGITTVFDMPNNIPSCTTEERLTAKKEAIDRQLTEAGIPIRYELYFGADRNHLSEIPKVKDAVIALKIFMGSSTGDLLIDDDETLEKAFRIAAENDLVVAVHAEDEAIISHHRLQHAGVSDPAIHSKIRDRQAAVSAVSKAIALSEKTGASLYVLHVSTEDEVTLIREAKSRGVRLFAETTPHHLFLNEDAYGEWGNFVKMNPPLRKMSDQQALLKALVDGTLDAVGTDHAPHTIDEKKRSYESAPAGIPGVETLLPLLLNACHEGSLTLEKVVAMTRTHVERFFHLQPNDDLVLVDLSLRRAVEPGRLRSKCGWSPFAGRILQGWPVYTILKSKVYSCAPEVAVIHAL